MASSDEEHYNNEHFDDEEDDNQEREQQQQGQQGQQPDNPIGRGRGHSRGIYGRPPPRPHQIRMTNRIDSHEAMHTLKTCMRVHLQPNIFNAMDIDRRDPDFFKRVRREFGLYYTHDPVQGTKAQAKDAITKYIRNNARKLVYGEKERVQLRIKKHGGTMLDHMPYYFKSDVWEALVKHWLKDESFKKRSQAAQDARKKLKNIHTSGSRSFDRRSREMVDELGNEPSPYSVYLKYHTKRNGDYTTEHVKDLVTRFVESCEKKNKDPEKVGLKMWARIVGPRKNTILGVPDVPFSKIIPDDPRLRTQSQTRRRRADPDSGSTSMSATQALTDPLVMQAVEQTVVYAREHPEEFNLAEEEIRTISEAVARGESDLPEDHPLTKETMRQLVGVMVSILNDIRVSREGKGHKAPSPPTSDDDEDGPRPPPFLLGPTRGGPRIN